MSKENISYVHSGSVLTKEQTDMMYKLAEKLIPMYLGNCEELDCEYFQWCGDSYGDRNTECYCLLNRARVYRNEAEEKHIKCPLGKMWDEDDI